MRTSRTERVNMVRLGYLISEITDLIDVAEKHSSKRKDSIYYEPVLAHCTKLYSRCKPDEDPNSPYGTFTSTFNQHLGEGRLNAVKNLSLQVVSRPVRHAIASELYTDIDIVNCHPVILYQYCKKNSIPCMALEELVKYRDERFKEILLKNPSLSRDDLKTAILSLLNGGKKDYKAITKKTSWIVTFFNEISNIINQVCSLNSSLHEKVKNSKDYEKYNLKGSTMAVFLQIIENKMLECMENVFIKHGWSIEELVPIHDGMMVPNYREGNIQEILQECSTAIKNQLGYDVQIITKPMRAHEDVKIDWPEDYAHYKDLCIDIGIKDDIVQDLLLSSFNDDDFADYFCSSYSDFLYYSGKLYQFNGVYWKFICNNVITNILSTEVYDKLMKEYETIVDRMDIAKTKKIFNGLQKLRNVTGKKNILESIKAKIEIADDIFDMNGDLLGFTNGVYDLQTNSFRQGKREDYITMTVGYDYQKVTTDRVTEFLSKVMPIDEERIALVEILATALRGRTLEKFNVMTGVGGNGKDALITCLMKHTLKDFYFEASSSVLTDELKSELSPGIAAMDKKRLVVYNEPKKHIKANMLKKLTGGDSMPVRGLYSSKVGITMHATQVLLCNQKPHIDEVTEAIARRLEVCPFRSLFRDKKKLETEFNPDDPYLFEGNEYYKSDTFGIECRLEMMNILLESYNNYRLNGHNLHPSPDSMKQMAKEYLADCDEFYGWFVTRYERTADGGGFAQLKDVYAEFKVSEYYGDLSKSARRAFTYKKLIEEARVNPNLRIHYRVCYRPTQEGVQEKYRNVLLGWMKRVHDEDY